MRRRKVVFLFDRSSSLTKAGECRPSGGAAATKRLECKGSCSLPNTPSACAQKGLIGAVTLSRARGCCETLQPSIPLQWGKRQRDANLNERTRVPPAPQHSHAESSPSDEVCRAGQRGRLVSSCSVIISQAAACHHTTPQGIMPLLHRSRTGNASADSEP
ncbi:hypothetical protein EYF80_024775 [Liparis tanakae]|uniref:Uncharacterized protein n=1 Tax=Liparis tanakae TaxID=230148 RepID=A0A4Z2HH27_9TELE|nr:hypothetical protein EYF80_024775 [Liparis tanakae]